MNFSIKIVVPESTENYRVTNYNKTEQKLMNLNVKKRVYERKIRITQRHTHTHTDAMN